MHDVSFVDEKDQTTLINKMLLSCPLHSVSEKMRKYIEEVIYPTKEGLQKTEDLKTYIEDE